MLKFYFRIFSIPKRSGQLRIQPLLLHHVFQGVILLLDGLATIMDFLTAVEVRVIIVLPGEDALPVDAAVERDPDPDRKVHDLFVEHGQRAREPHACRAGVAVRLGAEFRRAAAEELAVS